MHIVYFKHKLGYRWGNDPIMHAGPVDFYSRIDNILGAAQVEGDWRVDCWTKQAGAAKSLRTNERLITSVVRTVLNWKRPCGRCGARVLWENMYRSSSHFVHQAAMRWHPNFACLGPRICLLDDCIIQTSWKEFIKILTEKTVDVSK